MAPVMGVDRNDPMPVTIETLSDGRPIAPSIMTWVAVAPVDSAGNAWLTNLKSSSIALVDENSLDPGLHLDEITGVLGYWDSAGTKVDVTWDLSTDPQITSYRVFVSIDPFEDTRNATQIGGEIAGTLLIMNDFNGAPLDNKQSYWVVVVGFDGEVHRLAVDPLEILPWSESSFGSVGGDESESGASWVDQLLSGDMNQLIAVASALMILAGALLFIRPRRDAAPQPWEMGTQEFELEEEMTREAMGISEEEEIASSSILRPQGGEEFPEEDMSENPIAEAPEEWQGPDVSVGEILASENEELSLEGLNDLADGLEEEESEDIDVSFLDEVLDDD